MACPGPSFGSTFTAPAEGQATAGEAQNPCGNCGLLGQQRWPGLHFAHAEGGSGEAPTGGQATPRGAQNPRGNSRVGGQHLSLALQVAQAGMADSGATLRMKARISG